MLSFYYKTPYKFCIWIMVYDKKSNFQNCRLRVSVKRMNIRWWALFGQGTILQFLLSISVSSTPKYFSKWSSSLGNFIQLSPRLLTHRKPLNLLLNPFFTETYLSNLPSFLSVILCFSTVSHIQANNYLILPVLSKCFICP